jgi:hypothetical protein
MNTVLSKKLVRKKVLIPIIVWGFAKDGIMKTTEEAFDKIAQAVE